MFRLKTPSSASTMNKKRSRSSWNFRTRGRMRILQRLPERINRSHTKALDFWKVILEARRKWRNCLTFWKEMISNLKFYTQSKLTIKYEGRGRKIHLRLLKRFSMYAISGSLMYHNEVEKKEEGMDPGNRVIQYRREKWVEIPEWWLRGIPGPWLWRRPWDWRKLPDCNKRLEFFKRNVLRKR